MGLKMNVLVLNPPFKTIHGKFSAQSRSPSISKSGTVYFPYFLASLVGVLESGQHKVDFIDACADRIELKNIPAMLRYKPDLVVISTTTPSINSDIQTATFFNELYPSATILMVGTHATFKPDEVLSNRSIHCIARGEYEHIVLDVANGKSLGSIKGLSYRSSSGKIIHNLPRPPIKNLDSLPFVSQVYQRHLNIGNYFFAASDYPLVQILSSRGCSWGKCTFCMTPAFEGVYRERSVSHFVNELSWIATNLSVREIGFEDGCFGDNARIRRICEEIISRDLRIKWYCNVRVSLDYETMRIMKRAGCHLLTVGFESSSPVVLSNIRKGTTLQQMHDFVANARHSGLLVHGCFMVGNPGDTSAILNNNLKLAIEFGCDTVQFFPLMVYPGTEAYAWAIKNKLIIEDNWDSWVKPNGQYNTVISLPMLSRDELVDISNRSLKAYHLRPSYILYKSKRLISNPDEFIRTFKGFISFVHSTMRGGK